MRRLGRCGRKRFRRSRNRKQLQRTKPKNEDIDIQKHVILIKWMRNHGFDGRKLKLYNFISTGRGLMAMKTIKCNEVIVSVPQSLLITTSTVLNGSLGPYIKGFGTLTSLSVICSFLICEKFRGAESKWFPYINVLPEVYTTPAYFTASQLRALPSEDYHDAVQMITGIKKCFEATNMFFKSLPPPYPVLSYEDFLWAWHVVNTRSVYMKQPESQYISGDEDHYVLVPFLDLLNHSPDVKSEAYFDDKSKCFEIKTNTKFKKYEQTFICYGPHENKRLLYEYGFVVPNNQHSTVQFSLDEVLDVFPDIEKSKIDIITQNGFSKELNIAYDGFSCNFISCLNLFAMDKSNLSDWRRHIFENNEESDQLKSYKNLIIKKKLKRVKKKLEKYFKSDDCYDIKVKMIRCLYQESVDILQKNLQSHL